MIFFLSFLALTCAPYNHGLLLKVTKVDVEQAMGFSAWLIFNEKNYGAAATLLNQTTRMNIFDFVKENPGVHFRALSSYLNMPVGVLQYHLGLLVNGGLLSTFRDGRYKRYFESRKFTGTEMKVISAMRHQTSGRILTTLLKKPQTSHKDLAAQLCISSQALSWQMRYLGEMGFVKREVEALSVKYSLDEAICVAVGRCAMLLNGVTNPT